jgi:hypothetical protein
MWTAVLSLAEEARHFLKYSRMLLGEHLLIQNQNGQLFVAVLKSSGHDSLNFVLENPVLVLHRRHVLKYCKPSPRKRYWT